MDEFQDRVAVVTGAGSGIGFALAERLAAEGMRVVLADIEEAALKAAEEKLAAAGATTLALRTDVSKWEDMQALADKAFDAFGEVHVLCNNAGVGGSGSSAGPIWERTPEEWQYVTGVNLWGVIHGVHAFLPRMVAQEAEGHVVNTASLAGLVNGSGIYGVTKHAVVALSESIYQQLSLAEASVGISVLCPGFVNTNIWDVQRNLPEHLRQAEPAAQPEVAGQQAEAMRQFLATGLPPSEVADAVFEGVREGRFYIVPTQAWLKEGIRRRAEAVVKEQNPQVQNPAQRVARTAK